MKGNIKISDAVIKRLPVYRRYLEELMKNDVERISSNELSSLIGFTASQIRQDLNNFGGFGQQGYGYNIKGLYKEINAILGLDREYKMVIVGCGNLGTAIVHHYQSKHNTNFPITAIFDISPRQIGLVIHNIEVRDSNELTTFLQNNKVDIGVITATKTAAQTIADQLVAGGVKGIWNFAPVDLKVPSHIQLENVHVTDSLHLLAYHINRDMALD